MKTFYYFFVATVMALAMTSCGPTVQDYSDALSGTWQTPYEDMEDGFIESGTIYLTFAPIPEGETSSSVTARYTAHLDGQLNGTFSANCVVNLSGTYTIDADEEYPLDMRWDINSLDVEIDNIKMTDVASEFGSLMEDFAGAALGLSGKSSKKTLKRNLQKALESHCREEIIAKNDDIGSYGVEFDDDNKLYLIFTDSSIQFTRSK